MATQRVEDGAPPLQLTLLGGFELRQARGAPIGLSNHKAKLLLALLALAGPRPVSRDWLIGLLWSDRAEPQARASLRQTLWELRAVLRAVAPGALVVDGETVCLDPEAANSDVARFEQLMADGRPDALEAAAELYRGDLLDGVRVRDAACDAYLAPERARLRDLALSALDRLLELHAAAGSPERLADSAHRLLALDPFHEPAHRALMQMWAQQGHHDLALKQYATCRDRLRRELGVDPQPETERLAQAIGRREIPQPVATTPGNPDVLAAIAGKAPEPQRWPMLPKLLAGVAALALLAVASLGGLHIISAPPTDPEQKATARSAASPANPSVVVTALTSALYEADEARLVARLSSRLAAGLMARGRLAVVDATIDPAAAPAAIRYLLRGAASDTSAGLSVQLEIIDRETLQALWRAQYDLSPDALEARVEAVASDIFAALHAHSAAERETPSPAAAVAFVRGWHSFRAHTLDGDRLALDAFTQAVRHDPDFARAHAVLAAIYWRCWRYGCSRGRNLGLSGWGEAWERAEHHLEHAMGRPTPLAHHVASRLRFQQGRHEDAIAEAERAVSLDPESGDSVANLAELRTLTGLPNAALTQLERVRGTDLERALLFPRAYGRALFAAGRFAEAAAVLEQAVAERPGDLEALELLTAAYGHLGRHEAAAAATQGLDRLVRLHSRNPGGHYRLEIAEFDAAAYLPGDRALFLDGLRLAGVPD